MKNLDFKTDLDFNEFPSVSTEEWEAIIESDLKGKDYTDVLRWNPGEGISPLPFYRKEDLNKLLHVPETIKEKGDWKIIELIESKDPKSANEEALQALANGAMGLLISPDKNYLNSQEDLNVLLNDIHLEYITLHFANSVSTPEVAKWLKTWCDNNDLQTDELLITFNADPFSTAIRSGKLIDKDALTDHLHAFGDAFHTCTIDNTVFGESGATIVQQLAFALAAGNEFIGADKALAERMNVCFSTGSHYFLEIAKYRAFRIMWKQIEEEYGFSEQAPHLMATTALWNKSQSDAHNNMLRTTTEAMSAALGGCDALSLQRYDRHFESDSDFSSRIARNSQLILQEEAYLDKVADPGAGSYYVEKLTDELAEKSWTLFQEIEAQGGFHEALKNGFIQEQVKQARNEKVSAYRNRQKVLVGINKYQPESAETASADPGWPPSPLALSGNGSYTDIESLMPLNIEAELQKEEA